MEEKFISIIILLFILSLISERIANFIKLNTSSLAEKRDTGKAEKKREKHLQIISWLCGMVVATFGYFAVKNHNEFNPLLGFKNNEVLFGILTVFFTAIFLSFGSKFWHDLLDLVFQIKNLRQKMVDEKTYQVDSVKQLVSHLNEVNEASIKKAMQEHGEHIKSIPGVVAIGAGLEKINGNTSIPVIEVQVDSENAAKNIDDILLTNLDGNLKKVRTKIVLTDKIMAQFIYPGGEIRNNTMSAGGTIGAIVSDRDGPNQYLLSCYHVLKSQNHKWNGFSSQGLAADTTILATDPQSGQSQEVGFLSVGIRNKYLDAGLAQITNQGLIKSFAINRTVPIKGIRPINILDKYNKKSVFLKGKTNALLKDGFIYADSLTATIGYHDGSAQTFEGLFAISRTNGQQHVGVSQPGDSGSLVIDENCMVMGMIVGGNNHFSYVIPIETILNYFNVKI